MIPQRVIARFIRLFYLVLLISVSIIFLFIFIRYTYPFVIAFIVALLLNPLVTFIEQKWHLHRTIASFLTLSIIATFLITIVMICMLESIQAILFLAKYIPAHFQEFLQYLQVWIDSTLIPIYERLLLRYEHLQSAQQTTILKQLQETISQIAANGSTILEDFFITLTKLIRGLPNFLSVSLFILLGTFFISKDWYKLKRWYHKIIPDKFQNKIKAITKTFKHTLLRYFKAQLILTLISTTLIFIGLLVINVDYSFTLALLIGIVDFIPYLGTGIFFIPWIIYQFLNGNFDLTIQLCAIYMIVIIQRQLMEPKLLASQIGVNPLWMLITAFASYQLIGLFGVFVAPVIVMFMQTLSQTGILHYLWHYIYEGKA